MSKSLKNTVSRKTRLKFEVENVNSENGTLNVMGYTKVGEWCSSSIFTDDDQFDDFCKEKDVITSLEVVPLKYEIEAVPVEELCKEATTSVGDIKDEAVKFDGEILAQFYVEAENSTETNMSALHKEENFVECIQGSCRVCLTNCFNGQSIFAFYKKKYLPKIIQSITGIHVSSSDELPSMICFSCANLLLQAENIRNMFLTSDKFLKQQEAFETKVQSFSETEYIDVFNNKDSTLKVIVDQPIEDVLINFSQADVENKTITSLSGVKHVETSELIQESRLDCKLLKSCDTRTQLLPIDDQCIEERLEEDDGESIAVKQEGHLKSYETIKEMLPNHYVETRLEEDLEKINGVKEGRQSDVTYYLKTDEMQSDDYFDEERLEEYDEHHSDEERLGREEEQEVDPDRYSGSKNEVQKSSNESDSCDNETKTKNDCGNFKCNICLKTFSQGKSLMLHCRSHLQEKMKDPSPSKKLRDRSTELHLTAHNENNKLMCEKCGETFSDLLALSNHISEHKKGRVQEYVYDHNCDVCGKKNTSLAGHLNHMKIMHNLIDQKPFKCNECTVTFTRKHALLRHINKVHNPNPVKRERNFVCNTCGKQFYVKYHLEIHLLLHTGERPYACKYCEKAFTQFAALRTHTFIHTGEKPYCCKMCPKRYKQYGHLQYHQLTHSEERPHVCHICNHAFKVKKNLRIHMSVHSKKPFGCKTCGKCFILRCKAIEHIRKVHGKIKESEVEEHLCEDSSVISVEDIQGSCRVCLANYFKGQSIFTTYKRKYLPHIIHNLTQIIVTKDDELPSTICFKCADLLLQAELIRKSCISSDRFLKNQQRIKLREIKSVETNITENITKQTTLGNDEVHCKNINGRQNNYSSKEIVNANDPLYDSLSEENFKQEEISKESEDIFFKKQQSMKLREIKFVENAKNRNVTIEATSEYEEVDCRSNDGRQSNNSDQEILNANVLIYDPLSEENMSQEVVSKEPEERFVKRNYEIKLRKFQSVGNVKSENIKKDVTSGNYEAGYRNNDGQQINNTSEETLNISETADDPLLEESDLQEVLVESVAIKNENATGETKLPLLPELYVCVICAKRYTNLKSFNRHQRYHSSKNVRCPICPEEIDVEFINEHVLNHKEKHELICGDCDNTFDDLTNLYKHIIAHGKNASLADRVYERYVYECDLCENKASSLMVHQKHMKSMHNTRDAKPFKCFQCARRFSSKIIVMRHFNHLHNPKRDKEKDKKFVCQTCGKRFIANGNLKTHMRKHTGEKPYICHYCDKRFAYDVTLRVHIYTHTGEKPFLCSICGKRFKQYGHFKYHQLMHSDKRPHICSICHHGFRVKSSLTTHMKIHGKKEFPCKLCGSEYTMRCLLKKHMKKKHGLELLQE